MSETIQKLREIAGPEAEAVIAHMERLALRREQSRRFFVVGFRDGNVRIVFPDDDDPLRFEQQITADRVWGLESILPDAR